jgi:hypothetical protein
VKVRNTSFSAFLLLLCAALAVVPAVADTLYDNGPVNGDLNAWPINFGFAIANSFNLASGLNYTITGFQFGVWALPGDMPVSVNWDIGTSPFLHDRGIGTATLSSVFLFTNSFGYDVYEATATGLNVGLTAGNYFLALGGATSINGDALFWDENNGVGCSSPGCPSTSYEQGIGEIPGSESFTLTGSSQPTPEPGSMILFGSGVLALTWTLRRKMKV